MMSMRHYDERNTRRGNDSCHNTLHRHTRTSTRGTDVHLQVQEFIHFNPSSPSAEQRRRCEYIQPSHSESVFVDHLIHNKRHDTTSATNKSFTPLNATVRSSPEVFSPIIWILLRTLVPRRVRLLELSPFVLLGRTRGAVTTATSGGELCNEQSARYLNRG